MGKKNKKDAQGKKGKKNEEGQKEENEEAAEPRIGDCNLECKQKGFRLQKLKQLSSNIKLPKFQLEGGKEAHEFIGPVRIVLVTPSKGEYKRKILGSAAVSFAFFCMGATIMPIFFYSVSFSRDKNLGLHIILFTAAMLIPAAFLVMNLFNGSSSILKPRHRKIDYLVLKATAFVCIIVALKSLIFSKAIQSEKDLWRLKNISAHGASGVTAVLLFFIVDISTLPVLPCNTKRIWPKLALVLCIPTFIASTVCFMLSLFKPSFVTWLPSPMMQYVIMGFCVFYNILSVLNPLNNLSSGTPQT